METEMILRPMTMAERIYSYTQSQQLIMQTGCIGHLRAILAATTSTSIPVGMIIVRI